MTNRQERFWLGIAVLCLVFLLAFWGVSDYKEVQQEIMQQKAALDGRVR